MHWRDTTWARWLGWTLTFGLLFAGVVGPLAFRLSTNIAAPLALGCFVFSFVATYMIGARFRSPCWAAGPPVAVLAALLLMLALPESGPATPTAMGPMTGKDQFELMLMFGGWIFLGLLALVYAGLAAMGVRSGNRRTAERGQEERRIP